MNGPILDSHQIHEIIRGLSPEHILRKSPQGYVDDFVKAALDVYIPDLLQKNLQHKFFIPDETNYSDEAYYRCASELSVSYYLKQKAKAGLLTNFELEKRLNFNPNDNPPNLKDVDNLFHAGPTKVSLEVKCPQEDKQAPFPGTITLKSAGRTSDPQPSHHLTNEFDSYATAASGAHRCNRTNPH